MEQNNYFLHEEHKKNFSILMERGKVSHDDKDRIALFFIIAGNTDLNRKVDALYDFKHQYIYSDDWSSRADFSGGAACLVMLAFHLYNGYECNVYDVFSRLDYNNRKLAHRAIKVRFPY